MVVTTPSSHMLIAIYHCKPHSHYHFCFPPTSIQHEDINGTNDDALGNSAIESYTLGQRKGVSEIQVRGRANLDSSSLRTIVLFLLLYFLLLTLAFFRVSLQLSMKCYNLTG